jgi:hypothetical protein
VPIVFNQHYTGTMDYWDPAVTDGLACDREVILFNNAGVSSSSGEAAAENQSPEQSRSRLPFAGTDGMNVPPAARGGAGKRALACGSRDFPAS